MEMHGIHHIAVRVADLAVCEQFYADRLGLRVTLRHVFPDGRPRSVWLDAGDGCLIMLEQSEGTRRTTSAPDGLYLLAFRIAPEERSHWASRLPVVRTSEYTLYIEDPEGNRIALSHYPVAAS